MPESSNPVDKAMKALEGLRTAVKKRVGKEGGNLNDAMLQRIDTIETALLQLGPVQGMANVIGQQAQLMTYAFRNVERALEASTAHKEANGENGESETKGE